MYNIRANDRFLPVSTANMLRCSWPWQITDCPIMKKVAIRIVGMCLPITEGSRRKKNSYFMFLSFRLCFQTNKIKCGWNIPRLWHAGTSNSSIKQMPLADVEGEIFVCLGPKCFKYSYPVIVYVQPGSQTTEEGLGMFEETTVRQASQVKQGVQG